MAQQGPGKSYRKGISWMDLMEQFPDEQTAERWFAGQRWGDKPICPKDRKTNKIRALVVQRTNAQTLTGFAYNSSKEGSYVFTDDATAYDSLKGFKHHSVKHSVKQYVDGMAHTNGIESFWALLKRGYYGTYHHMSKWQLQRYINEFSGMHNTRRLDTNQQMERIAVGFIDKRLTYHNLKSSNPDRKTAPT